MSNEKALVPISLLPTQTVQQISPWHAERKSIVMPDPNPENGEVFKIGSKRINGKFEDMLYPAKPLCCRVAAAAGIAWNWRDSGPMGAPSRDYICYRMVGAMRLPDGTWQPLIGTKEIDLGVIEEELHEQFTKKASGGLTKSDAEGYQGEWKEVKETDDNGKEYKKNRFFLNESEKHRWIENKTRADLIQWRKNKMARAESGAMLRVIRAALGMKSSYTRAELERGFEVPRIDFVPDYNDPSVRQALIDHGVANMAGLFGQTSYVPSALHGGSSFEHPAIEAPRCDDDVIDVSVIKKPAPPPPSPPKSSQTQPSNNQQQAAKADPPKADPSATNGKGPDTAALNCTHCGDEITQKVVERSMKDFGKPLCYPKCQTAAREGKLEGVKAA